MVSLLRSPSYYPSWPAIKRVRSKRWCSGGRFDVLTPSKATLAPPAPPFCAPQVKLLDLGSPFASKPDVVAYDRHVLFTSDDPTGATRHRAPCPISTTRFDEAFVHEMTEELVGLVFAQADLVAYSCDLGVGIYLVPSALTLMDSREHLSALVVGKLCRHYAPLPLVPPPIVRLPDRTATCPLRTASSQATLLCDELHLHSTLGI